DEVRAIICPDKLTTMQWLDVIAAAHRIGLHTTATIMFGHVDAPRHWARHLLQLRVLQTESGGVTELVRLPFVPMEAPMQLGEEREPTEPRPRSIPPHPAPRSRTRRRTARARSAICAGAMLGSLDRRMGEATARTEVRHDRDLAWQRRAAARSRAWAGPARK